MIVPDRNAFIGGIAGAIFYYPDSGMWHPLLLVVVQGKRTGYAVNAGGEKWRLRVQPDGQWLARTCDYVPLDVVKLHTLQLRAWDVLTAARPVACLG